MKHVFLICSTLFVFSCQPNKTKNEACQELFVETGDKNFLEKSDCISELDNFKKAQQKSIEESLKRLEAEQKREMEEVKIPEQKLDDLPALKKRLMIAEFKDKLCKTLEPRLISNQTEYETATYTLNISKLENIGIVYNLAAEWPEGAADIQSIWYKSSGGEFCSDGGFTGGTCVVEFPKFKRLESYIFKGSPRDVHSQIECGRKI